MGGIVKWVLDHVKNINALATFGSLVGFPTAATVLARFSGMSWENVALFGLCALLCIAVGFLAISVSSAIGSGKRNSSKDVSADSISSEQEKKEFRTKARENGFREIAAYTKQRISVGDYFDAKFGSDSLRISIVEVADYEINETMSRNPAKKECAKISLGNLMMTRFTTTGNAKRLEKNAFAVPPGGAYGDDAVLGIASSIVVVLAVRITVDHINRENQSVDINVLIVY